MPVACPCGSRMLSTSADERKCIKCGTTCCSACAYSLRAATYCGGCAESILDGEGVPLTLSHVEPESWPPPTQGARQRPHTLVRGNDSALWLALARRDLRIRSPRLRLRLARRERAAEGANEADGPFSASC